MSNTHSPAGNGDTGTIDEAATETEHATATPSLARQLADTLAASATGVRFNIAQDTFQEAYASLLDAVPRDDRPALVAGRQVAAGSLGKRQTRCRDSSRPRLR